jgi:photosystem II stability/assembly factor-like uncharacterized protein
VTKGMRSGLALSLLLTASTLLRVTPVLAHGSFPDAQQILLPADRSEQIILGTNFGLIFSEDSGQTWLFSCEQGLSAYAGPYRITSLPSHRALAITASAGLIYSDDDSCTWQAARGPVADVLPFGFFADPWDGQRVYVLGAPRQDLRAGDSIYVSDDGGLSFGAPVFTASPGSALLSVLAAPGQPSTVLVAMYSADKHPVLLSSHDWGQRWETSADLVESFGEDPFELLWIDAADPERIYVRILGPFAETLGISKDGGKTFVQSISIPGKLSAFLKLASGTILVGGTVGVTGIGYRSTDDAQTFQPWPEAPRVHALAERNGKLYVGASNYDDGYVIAESEDEGTTLRPLAGFGQVGAMKSCVAAVCADSCAYYAGIGLWPQTVCGRASPPPEPGTDGGADGMDAAAGDGAPSGADRPADAASRGGSGGGCGCDLDGGTAPNRTELLLLGSAWWMIRRDRLRRRAGAGVTAARS